MSILASRAQRRQLARDNAKLPVALELVPRETWPSDTAADPNRLRVWRSRDFLVQEFRAPFPAICRLSVNRTSLDRERWAADITWDELQRLKSECGYALADAVEVYPPDGDVVNVANMRHLWVLSIPLPFVWRK